MSAADLHDTRIPVSQAGALGPALALLLALTVHPAMAQNAEAPAAPLPTLEGFPTEIAASLLRRKLAEDEAISNTRAPVMRAFVAMNFAWQTGSKLIVAFQGGRYEVWRDIAAIASQWSRVANVSFDFGLDSVARSARMYEPGDPPSIAQVRINLTPIDSRLRWSAVGRQALLPEFGPASMQLGGIVLTHPHWTAEDRADILHEFGHVLGFLHEQQRSDCLAEYRFEPGPNGELSVFQAYEAVYKVDRQWVEKNILLAIAYKGEASGVPDKRSLFLYPTEAGILPATKLGTQGPCYSARKNLRMSADDVRRARKDYPSETGGGFSGFRAGNIQPLRALASPGLSGSPILAEKLHRLELAARPLVYIRIASTRQRTTGERLRRALQDSNFVAPGVNLVAVSARTPSSPEVRYFDQEHRESALVVAGKVAAELDDHAVVRTRFFAVSPSKKKAPIEVWLPAGR